MSFWLAVWRGFKRGTWLGYIMLITGVGNGDIYWLIGAFIILAIAAYRERGPQGRHRAGKSASSYTTQRIDSSAVQGQELVSTKMIPPVKDSERMWD